LPFFFFFVLQELTVFYYDEGSVYKMLLANFFYRISSWQTTPSASIPLIRGSLMSEDMGAKIPGVRITPSKTNWVATPQGMPTKRAIAEAPSGLPYSRIVDVRVCYCHEKGVLSEREDGVRERIGIGKGKRKEGGKIE
jgi:hypothetical protein